MDRISLADDPNVRIAEAGSIQLKPHFARFPLIV
jgi:hypothetical protein